MNGTIRIGEDQTLILGVAPARSDPARYVAYLAEIERRMRASSLDPLAGLPLLDLNISFSVDERCLRLSYLRSAYLAMFGRWGYRLIVNEVFEPVRRQLASPDDEIIRPLPVWFIDLGAEFSPQGYAGTLDGLEESVVVIINGFLCLLPGNRHDAAWWDRLADLETLDLSAFDGKEWAWPKGPEHRWDH